MKNLLLFQVDILKDGKFIKTYKIYTNGHTEGFEKTGARVQINNEFLYCCAMRDSFLAASSPNIADIDAPSPSSIPKPARSGFLQGVCRLFEKQFCSIV